MKSDDAFFIPIGKALIISFVIVCLSILVLAWIGVNSQVECDPVDQITISGTLLGFEQNGSFWDVRVDNKTFLFYVWNEIYMSSLISHRIILNCCNCNASGFEKAHFDLISAYVDEVK